MNSSPRIVIVGGVAAGPKAAARARRLAPAADITIVEKEKVISYAGCGLPYYISGMVTDRKELMSTPIGVLRDPDFFAQLKRIKVLNETEALAIDREHKEVEVRHLPTGEVKRLPYDKLILATGAEHLEPNIPGKELRNVLRLKRIEDADLFRQHMLGDGCPSVAIIGGGLIGMEMTEAVVACGRGVTIIEMLPQILPMLDPEMAALVEKHLTELGVTVLTGTTVQRLEGDENGQVARVVTDHGTVQAQLVLMAVGIRPNADLARQAGLLIGPSGGIHVNQYLQTSDPDIYAAGDCAEKLCFVAGLPCALPLGSSANKEGRIAGANAVGRAERYPGVAGTTALKIFDWNVGRAGLSTTQAQALGVQVISATVAGPDKPHYYPGAKPVVLKLVAEKSTRRLVGIQAVGAGEVIKRVDVAVTAMTAKMTVDEVANLDLAYAPPYSEAMDVLITGANVLRNKLDGIVRGMTAPELRSRLASGEDLFLLDVRTPSEYERGRLEGSTLVPLGAVRERLHQIPRDRPIVAYCRSSLRAYEAARILAGAGYQDVTILDGGLLAWPYELCKQC